MSFWFGCTICGVCNGGDFQVVDPSTGRLYLGAVNNLYELYQENLSVKTRVATGPEDDSSECPSRQPCNFKKTQTNAHTKALAVFDKMSKLIECTSLFQGKTICCISLL